MIEHATRSVIPASAPESVKRRIEERRAGKRGKHKPQAEKITPVLSQADEVTEAERIAAHRKVTKAKLALL
jgi:hypothetical protein